MTRPLATLLPPVLLLLAACGAMGDQSAGVADTGAVFDAVALDTLRPDFGLDAPGGDVTTADAVELPEIEGPLIGLKGDPTYLVPGNRAKKTEVAAAGELVAWVEATDAAPLLVVWNVSTPELAPRSFSPPNLSHPHALALSDAFLVYVDDRYGDPDVFAIALDTGAEEAVVTLPGSAEKPAIQGSRVAWEDCRTCVTGPEMAGHEALREIVERELASGGELFRTSDGVADRAPSYGLLADGRLALAWVSGRATLRLERIERGISATHEVETSLLATQEVARVAVWQGLIAWRPSPLIVNPDSMIVNPDSMYPSDVFTTAVADGRTARLTTHAEIAGAMRVAPLASGTRLGWLEIPPGVPGTGRVRIAEGANPVTRAEVPGIVTFALGRSFVVFTAPRADNGDEEDVHVLRL